MTKASIALGLIFCGFNAHAECNITSVRDRVVAKAFDTYGGWSTDRGLTIEKFSEVCKKLVRANARLQIDGMASVLSNQSIGWASLSVKDMDTSVGVLDYGSANTQVNTFASQDKANEIMVDAINAALQNWDSLDRALEVLQSERNAAKASFSGKK